MKKMLVALLFVVGCVLSASAYSVAIQLPCGETIMTDSSSFEVVSMEEYQKVMSEIYC